MSESVSWQVLSSVCDAVYDASTSQTDRQSAYAQLDSISKRDDGLQLCMEVLENTQSVYAQVYACQTLTTMLSRTTGQCISPEHRILLLNYLLTYVSERQQLTSFVVNSICKLYARLTKTSWSDLCPPTDEMYAVMPYVFRRRYNDIIDMIQKVDTRASILCIQLVKEVMTEMNTWTTSPSITEHRRVAVSFRDNHLMNTFEMTAVMLANAVQNLDGIRNDGDTCALIGHVLDLCLQCLTFDFHMSLTDETSTDESNALQIPAAWKSIIVDKDLINIYFKLIAGLPDEISLKALLCAVQLCGIRRTVLSQAERMSFLQSILQGCLNMFASPRKLENKDIYHAFCRLLARVKGTFQLTEMIKCTSSYGPLLRAITEFTVQSFGLFDYSQNSIHYLLNFWHRTVGSMTYTRTDEPHLLDKTVPQVVKAYIDSRMTLTESVYQSNGDDPLDDLASLSQQMEQFAVIARCDYPATVKHIVDLITLYGGSTANDDRARLVLHGRLAWLVFMVGACIGGRVSFSTVEENDLLDGDMLARVLQLMDTTDNQLNPTLTSQSASTVKLELAYLYLLEQFRKTYISDQVQRFSQVYTRLKESVGLEDEAALMAVIARKIVRNLRCWSSSARVMEDSLTLLSDLSIGYTSSRRLKELEDIQFVIKHHSSNEFTILSPGCEVETMKSRSKFYTAISRLMVVDLGDDDVMLDEFMLPIATDIKTIASAIYADNMDASTSAAAKRALIGVCRDLRGVCHAFNTKTAFALLFDWMYPDYLAVIDRGMQIFADDHAFTSPCLKLMLELSENRSQRLCFEANSPSAILIFKQCSRVICTYGQQVIKRPMTDVKSEELYKNLLKGISVCFNILKMLIHGGSVNFGVFTLYGDDSLTDVLNMAIKLLAAIPENGEGIVKYSKLASSYFNFMEVLAAQHIPFISNLPADAFVFIVETLLVGINSINTGWVTAACSTLDEMLSYVYRRVRREGKQRRKAGQPPEGDSGLLALQCSPHVFEASLEAFLNRMVYEECKCQWSMSRPLLALILLQPNAFNAYKLRVLNNTMKAEQRPLIEDAFNQLMLDVDQTVTVRNKDKFTNNVTLFRRDISDVLRGKANEKAAKLSSAQDDML